MSREDSETLSSIIDSIEHTQSRVSQFLTTRSETVREDLNDVDALLSWILQRLNHIQKADT